MLIETSKVVRTWVEAPLLPPYPQGATETGGVIRGHGVIFFPIFSLCVSSLTLYSEITPKLQASDGDGHPHVRHGGSVHHLMRRSHLRHQIAQEQCTIPADFVSERAINTPTSNVNLNPGEGFKPEANPSGGDGEEATRGGGGG